MNLQIGCGQEKWTMFFANDMRFILHLSTWEVLVNGKGNWNFLENKLLTSGSLETQQKLDLQQQVHHS